MMEIDTRSLVVHSYMIKLLLKMPLSLQETAHRSVSIKCYHHEVFKDKDRIALCLVLKVVFNFVASAKLT